jgi:hypothetical protein
MVRKFYSSALRHAIRAEGDHELIHLPLVEIERRLAKP